MTVAAATLNRTLPHAEAYARAARQRARRIAMQGLLAALLISLTLAFGIVRLPWAVALAMVLALPPLLAMALFLLAPRAAFSVTFAAVCLFELFPTGASDALTDQVPFFWNVNTLMQRLVHVDFKAVPLNLMEIYLLIVGAVSLARAFLGRNVSLKAGPLILPICGYIVFVGIGWVNGMGTGGDFKISLAEVRSQLYFLLAYLLAVNLVRDRRHVRSMMVTMALCIGLKGILYTFRRYVTMAGLPLPDQGVGSHEEAFFFDTFVVLLITLKTFKVSPRLRTVMWALLPFVVTGSLATNRRAGTAALAIAIPLLFLAADRALPQRRTTIRYTALVLGVSFFIYYQAFRNSESMFAQPARAVQSMFQANARDASSNAYRDAENADLMATIRLAPVQGYGYGKRMLHAVKIVDISAEYEWWDVMTHNQILWVWMRVGSLGFLAFWLMVAAILIRACRILRDSSIFATEAVEGHREKEKGKRDEEGERARPFASLNARPRPFHGSGAVQNPHGSVQCSDGNGFTQSVAMFVLLTISMLMIFGLLDLQLSNYRDMLFAGFWTGVLAILPSLAPACCRTEEAGT